ncbi:Bgt-50077 [Blumeria graminis f. sp. tritici]|uniref:Bgt-50077 n=1 Tax=Blumeria graminis f. sp. tritici TaxID=62690 RepID=A0A9X9MPJ8_BLUGR|nr:Bgt-50077 [Blumeria graminis f. sp. tritici]
MEEMRQRLMLPIFWPSNSPDLNPTDAVWDRMKDYIQRHYPNLSGGNQRIQSNLRRIVRDT